MMFKEQYDEIKEMAETIFNNPELGYKEQKTKKTVVDFLKSVNPEIELEEFSTTGLKTSLGDGKELKVAFIAELDAVYAPTHRNADSDTGAAHNCGHYTQVAIALSLYKYLFQSKMFESFDYQLVFVFVPAEEYLDLTYRDKLLKDGVISYYGGKPEAMKLGVFDDIDCAICVHAIGGEFEKRTIDINTALAGFLYKYYEFTGKATHAGFDPFSSKNAYSMSTLFNVAIGLARQQFKDSEMVRVNPIVMDSDMSTNVIPNRIVVGTDLRAQSVEYIKEATKRIDDAAKGSAMALQGEVNITTKMGYLPFKQHRYLSEFVRETFQENDRIDVLLDNNAISAGGDIGDLSFMIPCIQIGHSGFTGTIHGDDFIDVDPEFLFEIFPEFLSEVLVKLSGRIDKSKLYKRSFSEYEKLIQSIVD
ncbi:M20/M25/M40 family metallo-hydrolase [Bacillus niameyensis]|uniref:M20/M25/M40 family metallo-hydrolase n=1 Tax=Bacillus niameyensis TaxID=1522308 RepID=UPI0007831126|nr:M20/M25/M40 family metallo-hydrolase [Bacillus niameyensis]